MLAMTLALAGCGGGERRDILDGAPRVPDDEGVATSLTFRSITLDGARTYEVSEDLLAFDTYNLQLEPMLRRRGQYVHIGLRGDVMEWMAGVSAVTPVEDRLFAYYTGVFSKVSAGRAQFRDGTVLRLADGLDPPDGGTLVEAEIDADTDEVVRLTPRASPRP